MRPVKISLAAAGSTPWVPVNMQQTQFNIGLGASITSGASLTYNVQHTFDSMDIDAIKVITISRTTTTATVTDTDHRLSTNDNVVIENSGTSNFDGPRDITYVDANTYTFTCLNSGPATSVGVTVVHRFHVYNHATMAAATTRLDGNYAFAVRGIRLNVSVYSSGKVDLIILEGMGR